ncbi:MAG: serine/threonine protein kinase, partial [Pirellulales bacterium]|nr:serine/threonine protein kinase [Pirellulales bacterium]
MSNSSRGGATDTTTMSSDDRIDILCDAYEKAYQSGKKPDFSDYLEDCDDSERDSLFAELMMLDVEFRQKRGEKPSTDDYLVRYPEFAPVIETIAFKRGLASTIRRPATESHVPGDRNVGHFQLERRLGAGTTGEVWEAFDPRLRRKVALKIPRARVLNEEEKHRFLREGQAAAQLKHPAIVPVHDVGHDGQTAYIVSDLIQGGDLRELLAEKRFEPSEAAELCAVLADGLHHAHEAGVVHRDFKPANVMIDDAGRPHITDFGLAKWSDDAHKMTLEGHVLGTPAYMAPEQAKGTVAKIDCRADVYALGAVLYEMLTGTTPFAGEPEEVMRMVIRDEPTGPRSIRRDIPRDLETICLKAMQKEPERRYATAQEMAVDLRRFIRGEPIIARRLSVWERSWRGVRRRPEFAVASALAAVTCIALGAAWILAQENRALL